MTARAAADEVSGNCACRPIRRRSVPFAGSDHAGVTGDEQEGPDEDEIVEAEHELEERGAELDEEIAEIERELEND
jgi:hypothetical protein